MRMSRFRLLIPMLALGLLGCFAPADFGPDAVRVETLPLSPSDPARTALGDVEVLSILRLSDPVPHFGGWSGMAWRGDVLTLVNDEGWWGDFRLSSDDTGRPLRIEPLGIHRLGGIGPDKAESDSEEIACLAQGCVVSFERRHRLEFYPDRLSGPPQAWDGPSGMADLPYNGGIEAMVALPDGQLILIAEEGGEENRSPAWIGRPGAWHPFLYQRQEDFHPSGATLLPDGDVLVAERSFSLLAGVALRLVRVARADIGPGVVVQGRELAVLAPPLTVDNYESLVARRRADGRTVVHIVSDDNFNPLQATLLMTVLLPR